MKRIAIITPGGIYAGHFSQGLPILMNMVKGLSSQFEITVFSYASTNKGIHHPNIKLISPPQWLPGSVLRWSFLLIRFTFEHSADRFKVIYSFWGYPTGTIAVVLGKLFKTPSLVTVLGGELASIPSLNYGHLRKKNTKKLVVWTCQQATKLTVISNYQLEILKSLSVNRTVEYIPFGTDETLFKKQEKVFTGGVLKILHVSNITHVKDQETLVHAFSILCQSQPAILRIVGADQMNGRLQVLARKLKIEEHIEFIGVVAYQDLPMHYDWADVFILTSLSEGQNNSLTDAAQAGLLIVSTSVGAAYDIGPTGIVTVPFGDANAIAENILQLSNNPALWKTKTAVSSKWAVDHNLSWSIDKLSSVCNALIK